MPFRSRKILTTAVTHLVLLALLSLTAGGPAWAQNQALQNDPAATLERLADDPRLNLSAEERDALRRAAASPQAAGILARLSAAGTMPDVDPSGAALGCCGDDRQAVRSPARKLALVGAELDALAAAPATGPVALDRLEGRFTAAQAELRADLAATTRALERGGIDAALLERHRQVVAEVNAGAAAVRRDLERAKNGDAAALAIAAQALSGTGEALGHRAYDPERPPFAVAEPVWREPGADPSTTKGADGPITGPAAEVKAVRTSRPKASPPPTADDLAETLDARITPEIRTLAASLGNDPRSIYDFVRNEIEFYPTWGSVQGSQRTLDMGRGNAADTASLLIALLRAAGIPARYVVGTVEVPVDAAQNWVGGAATPEVAQQLLAQGGIANVGLIGLSGDLEAIHLEHVWVEAWIDNVPSRGAVHVEGDTWLPLDAAFKQYRFHPASDLFAEVPFDAVFDPTDPPFLIDESLGRITDVDTEPFDAALSEWIQQADDYLLTRGLVDPTYQDILGGREVIPVTSSVFAGELPNRVVESTAAVSSLPATLRHRVRLHGFRSTFERAAGTATLTAELPMLAIDTRRLGLRFLPATQADADVLDAARAHGASSLPVYLVDVVPVLDLDGAEIARGDAMGMGRDFYFDVTLIGPDGADNVPFRVTAGDEIVVGVNGNGVSPEVVEKRFDAVPVAGAPEYLNQVQLHYWAETDYLGEVAASRRGVHPLRLPSVGLFSSTLTVSHVFGAPRSAVYAGRVMDVQRSVVGAAGADRQQVLGWALHSGLQGSYLEGSVFEQLEVAADGTPRPSGISAVHLLTAAFSNDVPIYHITPANAAAVTPLLQLPAAVERDIADALAAGQTVLAPESTLDLGVWQGTGYILRDETTGAGAYLISGGFAGGGILDCVRQLLPAWKTLLAFVLFLALVALVIWLILSAPVWVPAAGGAAAAFLFFLVVYRGLGPTSVPVAGPTR